MDTSENHNTHQKAGTLKEELKGILIIGTLILIFLSLIVKKYDNKKYLIFFLCFHSKDHPRRPTWTLDFAPAFLSGFTSLEPTIDFSNWSAVSHSKTRDFRFGVTFGDVTSGSGHVTAGLGSLPVMSLPVPVM